MTEEELYKDSQTLFVIKDHATVMFRVSVTGEINYNDELEPIKLIKLFISYCGYSFYIWTRSNGIWNQDGLVFSFYNGTVKIGNGYKPTRNGDEFLSYLKEYGPQLYMLDVLEY